MATKKVLTFTADEAQIASIGRPSNVVIEGNFGGGTVTHTVTGTVTPIRTPATAADTYQCLAYVTTFTLSGSTTPNLSITIEPVRD
ncbi:MAG: hypothetical protein COB84_01875 [Rhodobacteraceae bacterium]|nr:MAG: hypothetical protein COB84_01875 [Paracoccaceae bacterium]